MEEDLLQKLLSQISYDKIIFAIVVIILAYLITRLITFTFSRFSEKLGYYRITIKMIIPLLKFVVWTVSLMIIFGMTFELSSSEILAFSGLLGAALGFGLKDVFASIIGGIVITIEKPFNIGDKIRYKDYYGEVTDIGLRATKMITPFGDKVTLPNYLIFQDAIASANAGDIEMLVIIDIFVDSRSDYQLAMKIFEEAVITSKYFFINKDHPYVILLQDFPFYKRIRAKAYVHDLRKEFDYMSDVTSRVWKEFEKYDIRPPEPGVIEQVSGQESTYSKHSLA
ncbi:mechanosensitive ion channel protein MscS [Methanocella sp. CWC-04]|uniref:Mechanosensitive ion channel protein MscS n=1 Tax=Methanooceanicella nereidis TaxID=2052831 RepID=A0AAP2RD74_9EURY|nr:mechanosensitive ion channel domain-containing protein [Methanocella sp. CWC-04]MCD1295278.1 mechanosensitive ion channel protein MscS [Methanocella sp. CWC-04]